MKHRSLAGMTAAAVATLGCLVLVGWAFDIAALKSIVPGWVAVKPNTALAFVLIGVALWLQRNAEPSTLDLRLSRLRLARFCAVLAGLIGLLTLSEYVFDWNPGIDQWLFREPSGATGTSHPGRMAPDTAFCFVLLAAELAIARVSRTTTRTLVVSAILGSLVTTMALAAILAHLAPAPRTEGWWSLTIMAPLTAVLLAILGAAVVLGSWRDALGPRLTRFSREMWRMVACVGALTIAFALDARTEQEIARAHELRHRSFLLADELRQSGDDLTRMARTYVVTGEPVYKRHFQEILDIRDGRQPRPENYSMPYWDLVPGEGPAPRAGQQTIPLLELMRQAGFTEEELRKLAEAKANSDGLTIPEFEAMKLVESTGPVAEADRAKARMMMHDANYHQAKAAVMGPIRDFFVLVDERTLAAIHTAEEGATIYRWLFAASGLALMLALWRTYVALCDTLGGSLDEVHAHIRKIGSGDLSDAIPVRAGLESSVLGWLAETQAKLNDTDRERNRSAAVQSRLAAIVDSSADAIIGKTLTGVVTSWNAAAERLFGYSAEEMIGQPITRLFPGDRLEEETHLLGRTARGERIESYDTVRVGKDGRLVDVSLTISPVKDGEGRIVGVSKIVRDVSERKQAVEALARRADELAQFNAAAVGRELRMIELKQQVNDLARQLGHPPPYALGSLDEPGSDA